MEGIQIDDTMYAVSNIGIIHLQPMVQDLVQISKIQCYLTNHAFELGPSLFLVYIQQ
jgi:hypothetical protein